MKNEGGAVGVLADAKRRRATGKAADVRFCDSQKTYYGIFIGGTVAAADSSIFSYLLPSALRNAVAQSRPFRVSRDGRQCRWKVGITAVYDCVGL